MQRQELAGGHVGGGRCCERRALQVGLQQPAANRWPYGLANRLSCLTACVGPGGTAGGRKGGRGGCGGEHLAAHRAACTRANADCAMPCCTRCHAMPPCACAASRRAHAAAAATHAGPVPAPQQRPCGSPLDAGPHRRGARRRAAAKGVGVHGAGRTLHVALLVAKGALGTGAVQPAQAAEGASRQGAAGRCCALQHAAHRGAHAQAACTNGAHNTERRTQHPPAAPSASTLNPGRPAPAPSRSLEAAGGALEALGAQLALRCLGVGPVGARLAAAGAARRGRGAW